MRQQHRFETDNETAFREAAQIRTLIDDLGRSIQILACEIETDEERAGLHDTSDSAYPILARTLATRRDNLTVTIAVLKERLGKIEEMEPPRVKSAA